MFSCFKMSIGISGKCVFIVVMSLILAFFVAMDTHLYFTLQETSLVHQGPKVIGDFSPFRPLTMKLIMVDPYNHYIMGPSAEYFDEITHFSEVFWFITPNMISFTHLFISFVSAKLISHDNLCHRRIGVILYQFRSWLDDLDGVVYRSRSNTKGQYQSNHNTLGYYVDIYSDIIGGIILFVGILFYLFKVRPLANGNKGYSPLPLTKPQENGSVSPVPNPSPNRKFNFTNIISSFTSVPDRPQNGYTKKYLFYKVACTGVCVFLASGTWDKVVAKYTEIYQTDLKDPVLEELQTEALHSGSMWLIIYMWRIWEGQAIIHMVLLVVFVDKIWEFLNFFQYIGYVIIFVINLLSFIHISQVKSYVFGKH